MKTYFVALTFITFACCSFISFTEGKKRYLITDYGAVSDTAVINTAAIQKTIDECAANGGGVVVVPKGIFISGAIFLKKKVSLTVEKDGILKGSANQADYPQIQSGWEGEERLWTSAFINAIGVDDIELNGEGTIDGSGDEWVKRSPRRIPGDTTLRNTGSRLGRPRLICFEKCKNIKVSGLRLHNQAVWCLHILYCKKVIIKELNITADHNIPSSDGIDIDSSDDVTVTGCYIDVNDDCISIKSGKDEEGLRVNIPSENILIEQCTFAYGHGGVAMGSETSGGIRKVEVRNCTVEAGNWAPVRFKSQPSRGGVVEDITFRDIVIKDARMVFDFNMAWRMVGTVKPPATVLPVVRNIKLINISGHVSSGGNITGLEGSPIQNLSFQNCNITADNGLTVQYLTRTDFKGLKLTVKNGEPIIYK